MTALTRPVAQVIAARSNGEHVNAVLARCPWCGSSHWHSWNPGETDSFREPTCGAAGVYQIHLGTAEKVSAIRALRGEYATPEDVVGLVPLHIGYAFDSDEDGDVVGMVISTTVGGFVLWLDLGDAVQLAGHLVDIAGNRDQLRARYQRARGVTSDRARAVNVGEVGYGLVSPRRRRS